MASVDSGAAALMVLRSLSRVARAYSGIDAMYSSTSLAGTVFAPFSMVISYGLKLLNIVRAC